MTPLNARLSSEPEKMAALAARTMVGRNGVAEDFAGRTRARPVVRPLG